MYQPAVYNILGGINKEGGTNPFFYGVAWSLANNAKLESICPSTDADHKNFLKRFLAQHGTTAHHITFLVDDIDVTKSIAESYGYTVVGFDKTTDPCK